MSRSHTDVTVQVTLPAAAKGSALVHDTADQVGAKRTAAADRTGTEAAFPQCGQELLAEACTLGQVLDHVGGKWAVPILLAAIGGPVRFSELERLIQGISRRMLTLTLRNLERDGLLTRTVYPVVPPKVEYTATGMARELHDSLSGLTGWAERHRIDIATARASYDGEHAALPDAD